MDEARLRSLVEATFAERKLLERTDNKTAVETVIELLDRGKLRVATCEGPGKWTTHAWVKQAILLYFGITKMEVSHAGPLEFNDKIASKHGLDKAGVRVVPPGTIRYGAHVEAGAIVMPGFVNIGAYVGSG